MACEDGTTEINGRVYYVVQMPPSKAIPLQLKLVHIFGGSIGTLGAAMKGDMKTKAESLGKAVSIMFENCSEEDMFALITQVVETAKVDGKRISVDEHFTGEYLPDIYKVFFWVLGVNFTNFFGESGLDGFMDKLKNKMVQTMSEVQQAAKPPAQPQTSTDTFGNQ